MRRRQTRGERPSVRLVDRHDAAEVERSFGVVFHDLEFGMVEDDAAAAPLGPAVNDELLADGDDFFDPELIEPAADELAAEGVRAVFLQHGFEEAHAAREGASRRPL